MVGESESSAVRKARDAAQHIIHEPASRPNGWMLFSRGWCECQALPERFV